MVSMQLDIVISSRLFSIVLYITISISASRQIILVSDTSYDNRRMNLHAVTMSCTHGPQPRDTGKAKSERKRKENLISNGLNGVFSFWPPYSRRYSCCTLCLGYVCIETDKKEITFSIFLPDYKSNRKKK